MKRTVVCCLAVCLLFSGCASLFDGNYISTMPHEEQNGLHGSMNTQVDKYDELLEALITLAERGSRSGIIYVSNYDQEQIGTDMEKAVKTAIVRSPIAAYAVEEITWDLGMNRGQRAVAVTITYYHERPEILKIRKVSNMDEAAQLLYKELDNNSAGTVMHVDYYANVDFVQLVEKYAFENPQSVMETPQVSVNVYPQTGISRVIELKFTYQNSRDDLRLFKNQVTTFYASSKYLVNKESPDQEKFSQLYSHLMDRRFGEYTIETSITPAYSLLWHGAGDSKAFATLYAAICRLSELECQVITGTRQGEPWYWNLVKINGGYYHMDLLRSHEEGNLRLMLDNEMTGYVWNYSAHPETPEEMDPEIQETVPEETEPMETEPMETQPTETQPK